MDIQCRENLSPEEVQKCFEIRRKVFVEEQVIFKNDDRDQYDSTAIHIAAFLNKEIVGTVRVYNKENGTWYGSRLAVLKKYRKGNTGSLLVKKAMEIVKKRNCSRFFAYIQKQNVIFFKLLGWHPISDTIMYHARPHILMEADLSRV